MERKTLSQEQYHRKVMEQSHKKLATKVAVQSLYRLIIKGRAKKYYYESLIRLYSLTSTYIQASFISRNFYHIKLHIYFIY